MLKIKFYREILRLIRLKFLCSIFQRHYFKQHCVDPGGFLFYRCFISPRLINNLRHCEVIYKGKPLFHIENEQTHMESYLLYMAPDENEITHHSFLQPS
jgi:hypothetical protein